MSPHWKLLLRRVFRVRPATGLASRLAAARRSRLGFETLEDRVVPSTALVTNTNDSGSGSLRAALQGLPSVTTIDFDIPTSDSNYNGVTGVYTISLSSALPTVSSAVYINGASQPGYVVGGYPIIDLNGVSAGNSNGLKITSSGSIVEALAIGNFEQNGIDVTGSDNSVFDCYIGTDATGTTAQANGNDGVLVENGATNNTIGGVTAPAGNLISGNTGAGVQVDGASTTGNVVENNLIGVNAANTAAIVNGIDIETSGGSTANSILNNTQLSTGSWTELSTTDGNGFGTMELLPNGDIMAQEGNDTNVWKEITPDAFGSYLDGSLSTLASMSTERLYFGTVVLPNDDVMVYGGEYTNGSSTATDANSGEMYDPNTNTWSVIPSIPSSLDPDDQFGDDPLETLPNGDVLAGYLDGPQTFLYDPATNAWSAGPTKLYNDQTDEESWVKLPGSSANIVDYAMWKSMSTNPGYGQYYDTATNTWVATGSVPVELTEPVETELGPGMLMPNGLVFQVGANGVSEPPTNTALYNPATNTWTGGPTLPDGLSSDDAPGATLPDGNVIFAADSSTPTNQYSGPTDLLEYNATTNSIGQMSLPAALSEELDPGAGDIPSYVCRMCRMLDLPTGQVAFVDSTGNIWLYQEPEAVNPSWAPVINNVVSDGGDTYTLTGTQLNGMDEGAEYGDDANMATNYPIVQLTNAAGNVYDCTSFNWSSVGVATGNMPETTQFTLPAGLPVGTYNITVDGVGITSTPVSTYYNGTVLSFSPVVTTVSPDAGPLGGGATVTITGSSLANASEVYFGSDLGTIESDSATQIVVRTPAEDAGTVNVTVTSPSGNSGIVIADQYTYVTAPALTGLSANTGPAGGGATVTITGTNLANAMAVDFGLNPATIQSDSGSQIVVNTPAGAPGLVDVTVVTAGGTSPLVLADQYTYVPAPVVTGLSQSAGPIAGGTAITISGANFTGATAVDFGLTLADILTVSSNQIVVMNPAEGPGTVNVTVITAGGSSAMTAADQYTYVALPTVSSVAPADGPAYGGEAVTITGANLSNAIDVNFGSLLGIVTIDAANEIVALSPAEGAGTVDVTVVTAGGTSPVVADDEYTYVADPVVTTISPGGGPLTGGTTVTIAGSNLSNATFVNFGSFAGTIQSDSATQIVATSPAESEGTVDITVTTQFGGTSATSSADQFAFVPIPSVAGISTNQGPASGGTVVTLTGTNLANALEVEFGTTQATITSDTATQIVVVSPTESGGKVYVTVTTYGGTSSGTTANQFNFIPQPAVTGITPSEGSSAGGTSVAVMGSNLANATAVYFGSIQGTIVSDAASQIVVDSPVESPGIVDVTVVSVGGTSATSAADLYTIVPVPVVTAISPDAGPLTGKAAVTITGTGLANVAAVNFGLFTGTVLTDTGTQIVVDSPAENAGTVDVTVTTQGGGTSATSEADEYSFAPQPVVSGVGPNTGPLAGGISVTITGTSLALATAIDFGTNPATIVSDSANLLIVDSPGGIAGEADVTVTTPGGTSNTSPADRFTTNKASPTLAGLNSPTIAYGTAVVTLGGTLDANAGSLTVPAGETVQVTLAGVTQFAVLAANDTFSTTFDTGNLPVTGSPYPISFNYYGDANFTAASNSSAFLTVTPVAPAFANLSSPSISYQTPTTTISGSIATTATGPFVPAGENIQVTLAGVTQTATLTSNDTFSTTFDTAGLSVSGTTPYPISFTYDGDADFAGATGSSSLTVSQAAPVFTDLAAPTITQGTTTTTITGTLGSSTGGPAVPSGETVLITLDGNVEGATLSGDGTFSATFNTAALAASQTPYTIGFSYAGDREFSSATGSGELTVTTFDPTMSTVSVSAGQVASGNSVTVTLQAEDANGDDITSGGLPVSFAVSGSGGGTVGAAADNGNGTYTASFTGGLAGDVVLTATVGSQTVASTGDVTVTPGADDPANALIALAAADDPAGSGDTVTLQARDAFGNDLTTGGLSVSFGLAATTGGQGGYGTITDNNDGTYTASFTGTTAGGNSITATVASQAVSSSPTITVTPGPVVAAKSVVQLSTTTVEVGGQITLTLQTRDAYYNYETTGGQSVVFTLSSGASLGTVSPSTDHQNGTYTAVFTALSTGSVSFAATVGGTSVTLASPLTVAIGGDAVSASKSKVTAASSSVAAGTTTNVTLQAEDAQGIPETQGGLLVTFELGSGKGGQGTFAAANDNGNGTYTATFTGTIVGTNTITAIIVESSGKPKAVPIKIVPGAISWSKSAVSVSAASVKAGGKVTLTLQPEDAYGNKVNISGLAVAFAVGDGSVGQGAIGPAKYNSNGTYTATFTGTTKGLTSIAATINSQSVTTTAPTITVTPAAASAKTSLVILGTSEVAVGGAIGVTLQAVDVYGNDLTTGGLTVAFKLGKGSAKGKFGKVTDNKNGTYTVTFTASAAGTNTIEATIDGTLVSTTAPTINVS